MDMRILLMLVLIAVLVVSGCPKGDDGNSQTLRRDTSADDEFDDE